VLKLAQNPPVLTPKVGSLTDLQGRWWVAHTKARNEKALAWDLLRRDIGYFLPMRERVRFSGGRKRRVILPLFSSYLFFCGTENDRYAVMTTNRVCRTLEAVDQGRLIDELAAIEKALTGKAGLDPYPLPAIGQRCRIVAGPFEGIQGVVVQLSRHARLVLGVDLLRQAVEMEIEADLLEPID